MAELVELHKKTTPNESLIMMLEEMLADAKECRLLSIAGTYFDEEGQQIDFTYIEPLDELKMLGALELLKDYYKINEVMEYDEEYE